MSKSLPLDRNRRTVQLMPTYSNVVTVDTSGLATATDVVTINASTNFIRMYAVGGDVAVSFTGTATTTSFDHIIPNGQFVDVSEADGFGGATISAIILSGTITSFTVIEY